LSLKTVVEKTAETCIPNNTTDSGQHRAEF